MKTKELSYTALFVAFIAVCAQISIPSPIVPFTLQVFAITLIATLFKPKQATRIIVIYLIMGLIGFPIFAGGKGGIQTVLSPTFGFLLGFIPFTFLLSKSKHQETIFGKVIHTIIPYCLFYVFSLTVLYLNLKFVMNIEITPIKVITAYWFSFIPTDTISITLAYIIGYRIQQTLNKETSSHKLPL